MKKIQVKPKVELAEVLGKCDQCGDPKGQIYDFSTGRNLCLGCAK